MRTPLALSIALVLGGCTVDEFAATTTLPELTGDAAADAAPTSDAAEADAALVDSGTDTGIGPTFCDLQGSDDAGRALIGCADFDRPSALGFSTTDLGPGTLAVDTGASPTPPCHLRASLPTIATTGSATKRIEAISALAPSVTLDVDMRVGATPLSTDEMVTYLSVTPNGSENALGAFHLVRVGAIFRVTATGGNPPLKDLPALSVLTTGWHHVRIVLTHTPMSYVMSLDGVPVASVSGFAIPDPQTIALRVGAWNTTMRAAEASDEAHFDGVVARGM